MNKHVAIKVAKADIGRILDVLALTLGVDEQLKLSMLEGETELREIVSSLLAENEDDEGMVAVIKTQIEARKERISRVEHRIEARRNAIMSLMDCATLTKLPLPEATLSLRTLPPRPKVVDETLLPSAFTIEKTVTKPDNEAIEEALAHGASIPGVIMTNGGASLTVRRK